MPRVARIVVPDCPHHIVQRGNNQQDVFFTLDDRRVYLELLGEMSRRYGLELQGYCLMTNHVHLVAVPRDERSLAAAVGRAHFRYSQYVNRLHGRTGHLWQSRFFSVVLDEPHWWTALCYVERNPVRARMTRRAWEYPWSSAAFHAGKPPPPKAEKYTPPELINAARWRAASKGVNWEKQLVDPQDDETMKRLRVGTRTGRPLGSDSFLGKLETRLGRRLRALPVGRPKKPKSERKHREKTAARKSQK